MISYMIYINFKDTLSYQLWMRIESNFYQLYITLKTYENKISTQ